MGTRQLMPLPACLKQCGLDGHRGADPTCRGSRSRDRFRECPALDCLAEPHVGVRLCGHVRMFASWALAEEKMGGGDARHPPSGRSYFGCLLGIVTVAVQVAEFPATSNPR